MVSGIAVVVPTLDLFCQYFESEVSIACIIMATVFLFLFQERLEMDGMAARMADINLTSE